MNRFLSLPRSLSGKIVMLSCLIAITVSGIIGGYSFHKTKDITLDASIEGLAGETRLLALKFKSAYEEMQNDAFIVSRTPPVQGIIRSIKNRGTDDYDGSTLALWRERLETNFKSIMNVRSHYTQIRYIGISDAGKELARVNHQHGKVSSVAAKNLQSKEKEPYFQAGIKLSRNDVFFSEVTYNREEGEVEATYTPTVRTVVPVYDANDKIFGIIVINANYADLLRRTYQEVSPEKHSFIVNHAGDYIEYRQDESISNFEFHQNYSVPPPPIVEKVKSSKTKEAYFDDDSSITYFVRLNIHAKKPFAFIGVALQVPNHILLAKALKTRRNATILIMALVLASFIAALFLSIRLTKPLREMTQNITKAKNYKADLELPIESKDEIGELALAFKGAVGNMLAAEERFRSAMEYSAVGMALVSIEGKWLKVNKAMSDTFGYSEQDLLATDFQQLTHSEDLEKDEKFVEQILKKEINHYVIEKRYFHQDGTLIWALLNVSLVWKKKNQPDHFIFQIQDITKLKVANEALQEANAELEEFAYRTSHDLRAPLVSSIGLLDVVKKSMQSNKTDKAFKAIDLIKGSLSKLESLVDDILALTQTKYIKEQEQAIDVVDIIKESIEKFSYMENADRVDIKTDLQCDKTLHTQRSRLTLIVENLISNAIKYQDVNNASSFIKISTQDKHRTFILTVEDNGLGIPKEQQGKLFSMFSRFHTKVSFGSGLGLYMVKKSADLIGAELTFEDSSTGGCIFKLKVPLNKKGKS